MTTTGSTVRRERYLVTDLFRVGEVHTVPTDLDRLTIGGALPTSVLTYRPAPEHETGVINLGAPAEVRLDGATFLLGHLDCLYAGDQVQAIQFQAPGEFYFASCPARETHPSVVLALSQAETTPVGDAEHASRRTIRKFICPGRIESSQLVMGFTELETGSVWNTMPAHTHVRRSEIYLYFDLGDGMVVHLMGKPEETEHMIVRDRQAVLSPNWSMHSGAGTNAYRFVWVMAGQNKEFADMDPIPMGALN